MKAALFFDIDGTLWDYDHYIPESTVRAIREARKNGHLALLCSGRSRSFITEPVLLDIGFDGIVCACGCHIEVNGQVIFEKIIEREEAVRAIELVRSYGFHPILEGPEYTYMDIEEFPIGQPFADILRRDMGEMLLPINGENYGKWRMNKFSCEVKDQERAPACYEKLGKDYEIIHHDSEVIEVVPKGFSKATGMMHACELLGVDPAYTYAFGDSENDLEMLRAAAVGIAMGNGTDNAKAAADYVTTAFDDDGIMNAMKHFGLIS